MKKPIMMLLCLVLALSALVSCGVSMHDVNVSIIETTVHRENPEGILGLEAYPYGEPLSDSVIKESASGYNDYITQQGNNIHPGFLRLKEIYVENTSNDDIYVRVIATFPAAFCQEDDPIMDIYYSEDGEKDTEKGFTVTKKYDTAGNYIMIFTYQKPLAAGEVTYWPSLEAFGIKDSASYDKILSCFDALGDKPFDVAVVANAITAKGYANATEAFVDYDKKAVE